MTHPTVKHPTRSAREDAGADALSVAVCVAAVALFVLLAWSQGVCTQDDSFISFRYARNLARGDGLVFNPGERVEGYTNFLWTALFGGMIGLGLDPVPVSRVLGIVCGAALVVMTWVFARRLFRGSAWPRAVAPLLVAVSPPLLAESAMGLETALFAFLVLLGTFRCLLELERGARIPWHALVLALAAMTRPEGVLVFALVCGCCVLARAREPRALLPFLARSVVWFSVPVATYLGWRVSYYGHLFPNTYYAKTGGGWQQLRFGADYLESFLGNVKWLPLPFYLAAWARIRAREVLFLLALVTSYAGYVICVGGDFKPSYRFIVPVLAPLWLVVAAGLEVIAGWLSRVPSPGASPVLAALCVAAVAFGGSMLWSFEDTFGFVERRRELMTDATVPAVAEWLDRNTPAGEYVVQASAGRLPYLSDASFIDLWGLTDEVIARSPDLTSHTPGHLRSNPEYVLERRPLYVMLSPRHGPKPVRKRDYRPLYAAERQLLALQGFREQYELLNEPLAGGYFHVFRRKDR